MLNLVKTWPTDLNLLREEKLQRHRQSYLVNLISSGNWAHTHCFEFIPRTFSSVFLTQSMCEPSVTILPCAMQHRLITCLNQCSCLEIPLVPPPFHGSSSHGIRGGFTGPLFRRLLLLHEHARESSPGPSSLADDYKSELKEQLPLIAGSAAAGVVFIVSLVAISIVCSR